jgi:hypothetical protein
MLAILKNLGRFIQHLKPDPYGEVSPACGGIAGKDCELFWSTGVLECWQKRKAEFYLDLVFSLPHYSTTPSLQQTATRG